MGDRTTVRLTVPTELAETTEQVFTAARYSEDVGERDADEKLTCFSFHDVNYGELGFLDKLVDRGIPFDSEWESGAEYGPGTYHVRFTEDGDLEEVRLNKGENNPPLDDLLALIDKPIELRQYIEAFANSLGVMSWENQVEYGKRYLAVKLIG